MVYISRQALAVTNWEVVNLPTSRPRRLCKAPGCKSLVPVGVGGLCDEHKQVQQKRYDNRRGSASERGYDHRWSKARKMFLRENTLCKHCLEKDETTIAAEVDHIVPHKGNYDLFWDKDNWQSLCSTCHKIKTAKEDGAFGNTMRANSLSGQQ